MAMQPKVNEKDIFRPLANFPPSIWGNYFESFSLQDSEFDLYTKEVEALKEKVKDMLKQSTGELTENIKFIDLLCRLGISYHFETEIEEELTHIFTNLSNFFDDNNYDLYTTALTFQVLRRYGCKVSCDVFKKFKENDGEFKKSIINDVKGLLSLYEATFLNVHGEDILDEAFAFTRQQLETFAMQSNSPLAKYVRNSLLQSFQQGVERLQVKEFISFYEEDESHNEFLLKFAKLDFNRLQLLYKKELASLSRWWKDLNLAEKLPYTRDRIAEIYFLAVGAHFEPQFALSRIMISKYIQMLTLVDDTYDSYGTIDELQCFAAAFERCTIDATDELPEYMKDLYRATLNLFNETENDGRDEGRPYRNSYAKEMFKELVRGYIVEAQWINDGYLPTFEEYMQNGLATSTCGVLVAASLIGMENVVGIHEYEMVVNNSKIYKAFRIFGRLQDDIMTRQDELEKENYFSSIDCYMRKYGVSRKEATEKIKKMCENAWMDIKEESMKKHNVMSRILFKYYVSLTRTIKFMYRNVDSFTNSLSLKDDIASLFLQPLPL